MANLLINSSYLSSQKAKAVKYNVNSKSKMTGIPFAGLMLFNSYLNP